MNHLPLASIDPNVIPIVVPIAVFLFVISIVAIKKYADVQKQKFWHETARLAIEKGQPVPLLPIAPKNGNETPPPRSAIGRDVRAGLILLGVGAGCYFAFRTANFGPAMFAFYIPIFIGAALLLNALFTALIASKSSDSDRPSPSPKA